MKIVFLNSKPNFSHEKRKRIFCSLIKTFTLKTLNNVADSRELGYHDFKYIFSKFLRNIQHKTVPDLEILWLLLRYGRSHDVIVSNTVCYEIFFWTYRTVGDFLFFFLPRFFPFSSFFNIFFFYIYPAWKYSSALTVKITKDSLSPWNYTNYIAGVIFIGSWGR